MTPWPDLGGAGTSAAHHDPPRRGGDPLGELLGPVVATTASTWTVGASGERKTAALLTRLPAGWHALHDRRLPGRRANIDHFVIGPPGVVLIDSKQYQGRLKILGGRLWYGTRDLQGVIDLVHWEADTCATTLRHPVQAALCIHGARLPRAWLHWRDTLVAGPRGLLDTLTQLPGVLDADTVDELADRAHTLFPPASGAL